MKASERRELMAEYLLEMGSARVEDLIERFGVSRMTVHRYLVTLERQGILRRAHGVVTLQPSNLYESSFRYRSSVGRAEKRALARAASEYVEPGHVVMVDDSTTALALLPEVAQVKPLTLISNSVAAVEALIRREDNDFVSLGGSYSRGYNAFVGIECERMIRNLRANLLYMSVSSVQGTEAFHQDERVVRVKRAMMAASSRKILAIDGSKFERIALHKIADLEEFDTVLCTSDMPPDTLAALERAGVETRIVEKES